MHQRDEDRLTPGLDHTVVLLSAALLTLVLDQGQDLDHDQDPGLTLTLPVDPGLVHAPMAVPIPVPRTLDVMDAATDAHGQGPALDPGLTGTGAPAHHALLYHTGEEPGREQKEQDPTGPGLGLAPLVATGAAALVDESHHLGSWRRMN